MKKSDGSNHQEGYHFVKIKSILGARDEVESKKWSDEGSKGS